MNPDGIKGLEIVYSEGKRFIRLSETQCSDLQILARNLDKDAGRLILGTSKGGAQ
jgi:hypothetical protein